jgi:PTH2 family peptidyl-tRNA hydrolase
MEAKQEHEFKFKQIIVIRADLGMSRGKAIAQACHVAVKAAIVARFMHPDVYDGWDGEGHAKIVCKASSLEELRALEQQAKAAGLPCASIADFGLTELEPGTVTALAIGPAPVEQVDRITKQLKLV